MLVQHVRVACRPEPRAEPAQLCAEALRPFWVDELPRRSEEGSRTASRDAHLMEVFRIGAQPRPGIVVDELATLGRERASEHLAGRCVRGKRHGRELGREVKRAKELRPELAVLGPGLQQHALETPERALVAVEQLHLQLAEALDDAPSLEDRDRILDDLGAVSQDDPALRAHTGDLRELPIAQVDDQEVGQLRRSGLCGAGHLELDARRAVRDLELPESRASLGSPAQRDRVPSEPQVVRVVVRGLEDARRQRLAEIGKVEALTRDELQLPFDCAAASSQRSELGRSCRLGLVNEPGNGAAREAH